jgi:hypothetical protein
MAIEFNGSSQYLSASSTLLAAEPIDIICHGNPDINTTYAVALSLGNNGVDGSYRHVFDGSTGGDPIRGSKESDAGAIGNADSSTGFSTATWHVAGTSFISDTSRAAYKDGGSKGTNATNAADPTPDFFTIGALRRSSVSNYFDGKLAEAYVLNANMSDAQHAARGKGFSALWDVPVKNVRGWYTLLRTTDLNNRMGGGYPALTATGSPTQAAHPSKVIYPRLGGLITL